MTLDVQNFVGIVRGEGWEIFRGNRIDEPRVVLGPIGYTPSGPVKLSLDTDGKVSVLDAPLNTTFLKEFVLALKHGDYVTFSGDEITFSQTEGTSVTYRISGYNVDTELFSGVRIV